MKERAINRIFDNILNKAFDVDELIKSQPEGFDIRILYNNDLDRYSCVECDQLTSAVCSGKGNVYFRHKPSPVYCVYKDKLINSALLNDYEKVRLSKESPRHKELKNLIGALLYDEPNVELDSIDIDTKYLMKSGERRRPDVYCRYDNKEVAFEIQLSPLPLHYIQHRHEFYKKNNIYLIWILDIKDSPKKLKSFERDLKHTWKHQNLFILNEDSRNRLELNCHYKKPFNDNGSYKEKWYDSSINLDQLKFDQVEMSCFYYDYLSMRTNVETEILRLKQEEILRQAEEENKRTKQNAIDLITSLRAKISHWRSKDYNFYSLIHQINSLNNIEIEELNLQINLNKTMQGLPQFLFFIKSYKELSTDFKSILIELIFTCQNLKFNINLKDLNDDGVIQYLYNNQDLDKYLFKLLPSLFKRRYVLTKQDEDFVLSNIANGEYEYMLLKTYSHCTNDYELEFVKNNFRYIRFIKSAIEMNRLDSSVKSWVQYMMPIMNNYRGLWKYTKLVLANTPLGKELNKVDRKNTIKAKISEFNLEIVKQDENCNSLLGRLYPQIFLIN